MGHHTPTLTQEINRQLKRADLTPLIPTDHDNWDLARRMAFLEFAVSHFDRTDHDLENSWWRSHGKIWQEMVEENILVFTGEARPE